MEDPAMIKLYQEGGGLTVAAPPINNACLPTIYDKLDADARSKVKVINRMLDKRYRVQEKLICRYREDALRILRNRRSVIERDLKGILRKYPNMDDLPFLSVKLSIPNRTENKLGKFKAYSTEAIGMKGLSEDKMNNPFCDRYYGHHLGWNNLHGSRRLAPLPPRNNKLQISRPLIMSKRLSASDNILHKKLTVYYNRGSEDDDAMTV